MSDREEMVALRDAYFDAKDTLAPFITPWLSNCFENLVEKDTQAAFYSLYDDLIDDGYTSREIRLLSALAICDVQDEMREDIEDYEAEA